MKLRVFRRSGSTSGVAEAKKIQSPAYPYVMDCFLRSRTESGNPSNIEYEEEDVNVYIVNLLCLLLDPVYLLQVHKYVADYDTDVFQKVESTMDKRLRYWVYKANADHLLVKLGIFGYGDDSPAGPDKPAGPLSDRSAQAAAERGKMYYDFARCYCRSLARCSTGLADVLGKLAFGFEKYVLILDYMRGEYFGILDTLSQGEIFHLQRELDQVKNQELIKKKYDDLLDLYLEWKDTSEPELLSGMEAVLKELKKLDPTCNFSIPH